MEQELQESPTAVGIDAPAWTPALVQRYLGETYDVEYSRASCRRLLKEAGLSYQKPCPNAPDADPEGHDRSQNDLNNSERRWMPR